MLFRSANRGFNLDKNLNSIWFDDNSMAVAKGWIATASSIRGLAGKLELPADALAASVDRYNRGIETDQDEFGRGRPDATTIEKGPFYGVAIWPATYNTQGGPRRSAKGEILDPWGAPIPGLFGAGELGSIFNTLYPGGVNYGEALTSGRIAGASAIGLEPK